MQPISGQIQFLSRPTAARIYTLMPQRKLPAIYQEAEMYIIPDHLKRYLLMLKADPRFTSNKRLSFSATYPQSFSFSVLKNTETEGFFISPAQNTFYLL